MQPPYSNDAEAWLIRAERDLLGVRHALHLDPPLREFTAYHAQQAAEKALKGYLTAYGVRFRKTHELEELVEQCAKIDDNFITLLPTLRILSPYIAEFRYPDGPLEPDEETAQDAVRRATEVLVFVRVLLPAPADGSSSSP